MNLKVCIECGDLADGTRCHACAAQAAQRRDQRRGSAHARGYTRAWNKQAAQVKRAQPTCDVCGTTEDLTVDHIVPKRRGGTDDRDNLVTLCRRHNSSKGAG